MSSIALRTAAKVDAALPEEEAVFLGVELADPLAAQLADLGGDVVAHLRGVRDVVVHLHVARADRVEDAQVLGGAQPRLDAEDHAAVLGLRRDALQPADDLRLAVGVVAQVTALEEREQDDADVRARGRRRCCR